MILERLSEGARREIANLPDEDRRALGREISGDLPPDLDPIVREFFETIQKRPLIDPSVDVVALIREGRGD